MQARGLVFRRGVAFRFSLAILWALVALVCGPSWSSADGYSTFGTAVGVAHRQVRDDVVAPLRWDGVGVRLEFSYDRLSEGGRHHARLGIPFTKVENRYGAAGYTTGLDVAYGYLRVVDARFAGGRIDLGGVLNLALDLEFFEDWDDEHLYWLNAYELGPWVVWSRELGNGRRLAVGLDIPVVALTSRVPRRHLYKTDPLEDIWFHLSRSHENLSLTSLDKYFAVTVRCDYERAPCRGRPLGISLVLDYRTHSEPERVQILTATVFFRGLFSIGCEKPGE